MPMKKCGSSSPKHTRGKKVCHPIVGMIYKDEMKGYTDTVGTPMPDKEYCKKHDWYYYKGSACGKCIDLDPQYIDMFGKVVEDSGGMKNDMDKPDWSLIPLETIEGIVRVLTYGAKKYERDNWKKVSINRNFAAFLRHITKWQTGEDYDQESGLHHLDHALCDLMFIKWRLDNVGFKKHNGNI